MKTPDVVQQYTSHETQQSELKTSAAAGGTDDFKPLEKLRALYWAEVHIRESKAGCGLIRAWNGPTMSQELLYALATGIVVSYCRSFVKNDGLSNVGTTFRVFTVDPAKGKLHEHLMLARDTLFAHKDRLREHEVLALADRDELSKIHVIVGQDGSTECCIFQRDRRALRLSNRAFAPSFIGYARTFL